MTYYDETKQSQPALVSRQNTWSQDWGVTGLSLEIGLPKYGATDEHERQNKRGDNV